MGVVYRGMHPGLDVPVAIKVLAESFSGDLNFRQRFQREAATIASLNHPGIVRVYDFDAAEGSLFIVMEYVEGRTLRAWLGECGRFTAEVSLDLIQQLLSAVGAAHSHGVVHRDLKPDNVLISNQGKTKILDFGISKVIDDSRNLTATGSLVGTPAYMSPEQVKGEEVDHRADVYALGAILYELMHGEPPFAGSMAAVLHSQVFDQPRPSTAIPPQIMEVVWKAMAKNPSQRFQSCEEFSGALLYAPRGRHVPPPPPEAPPPTPAGGVFFKLPGGLSLPRLGHGAESVGGCSHSGCTATDGWQCSYVDATGARCQTWWCKRHIVFDGATPFCSRHASVLKALAATAGTIREIKHRPAVDDRALPLAAMVCEDAERDLTELLRRRYQGRKDMKIVSDKTIRQTWEGRTEVAWERSWAAVQNQGYLTRIGVRVSVTEPDTVKVMIGNSVVFAAVPDWISRRREGEPPDHADRARFQARVIEAVLEHVDKPTAHPKLPHPNGHAPHEGVPERLPRLNQALLDGMVLRYLSTATRQVAYDVAEHLALPFPAIEGTLRSLAAASFIEALGIASDHAPSQGRPLNERMAYALTNQGRARAEELGAAGTRYVGPAPVSLEEYRAVLAEATKPVAVDSMRLAVAMADLEITPAVAESVRAAVNSRGSVFIYGAAGNGKTSLARRMVALLGGPLLVPVALDLDGEVLRVFDPAVHRLEGEQPEDRRWRRVQRPLVQVGGEFVLEMLDPTWEPGSRTYEAPLQVKANGGLLLIDDLGRQRVTAKQTLDRLMVPMEQAADYLNLSASGRKGEVPFKPLLALSTNLKPADLLDEAYLRRLDYKIHMPDPSWEAYRRIFERERARLAIPDGREALELIRSLYGGRPLRGNHPRDLLERLADVASARGVPATLSPELIEAAWQTLFVTA
jgi:predicted Ser/Thr protein kinase